MKQNDKTEYERHLAALKKWNEKRAEMEKKGIEKFYQLKETFRNQKLKP